MDLKKINIVIVPEGARRVRQLKVPKLLLLIVFPLLVGAGLLLAWVVRDYQSVKTDFPRLAHLQKENSQQRQQIASLTEKIQIIQKKLSQLHLELRIG